MDDNKAEIKLWDIAKLKDVIERKFFKKQSELSLLEHAGNFFYRMSKSDQFKTISTYEDGLKIFVKYQMKLAKENDFAIIKTLYEENRKDAFNLKSEYKKYDIPIKAFDVELAKNFQAYMSGRVKSKNTVGIHLRSVQSILNDAEGSFQELKGHKPLEGIKKKSTANELIILTMDEIESIRGLSFEENTSKFHVRNYFLFMFNNMGMNFMDVALAKVHQYDDQYFSYTRKKTESEGDFFCIEQSEENRAIIEYYIKDKQKDDYLFPLIPKDTPKERIHRVESDKRKWFCNHIKDIAKMLEIDKNLTTYTPRDTWTNIGLEMGIDIRKISSGLGHSTIDVTQKHYSQSVQAKLLNEINAQITKSPEPS